MILGIIQARMSSARLPGKVLMHINGIPMLLIMIDRAKISKRIDKLIIATSFEKTDDPIESLCNNEGIFCFRGDLNDVLKRFYWASELIKPDHIVRLTGDCPLIEPEIIDATIKTHIDGGFDYTRNYGFPDGWDTEVITKKALDVAYRDAGSPYEREHVTPYFYNHPELFKLGRYSNNGDDLSYLKLSVDTEEDFYKVQRLINICLLSTLEIHRNI